MKLKIISDLHIEFMEFNNIPKILKRKFPEHEDDKDTTLVCAGDIGTYNKYNSTYKPFFQIMSKRFKHVIIVPGNHSWYNSSVWGKEKEFWSDKKIPKNVHYMDNNHVIIDDIVFIGSCLWTNFNDSDPLALFHAKSSMNDFRLIKKRDYEICEMYGQAIESNRLSPEDTVFRFYESKAYIQLILSMHRDKKCVVVTHHGISKKCVHPKYNNDLLNYAFYSNLDDLILDNGNLAYVISGHTHDSYDFMLDATRVLANPFGYYYVEENKNFNPNLVVEV